jgi:hypothetical protein
VGVRLMGSQTLGSGAVRLTYEQAAKPTLGSLATQDSPAHDCGRARIVARAVDRANDDGASPQRNPDNYG